MPLNPYHLEVVSPTQVDKNDCYTLSCVGVTHYINGKAEFIGIEQWKREHYLFKARAHARTLMHARARAHTQHTPHTTHSGDHPHPDFQNVPAVEAVQAVAQRCAQQADRQAAVRQVESTNGALRGLS